MIMKQSGLYVCAPTKKRKIEKTVDKLVAKKVSKILSQRNFIQSTDSKYTGKADLIPEFDPEKSEITAINWLHKIEQIGMINSWSDEQKSLCMQSRLTGLAKVWYNGLTDYNLNWDEWKLAISRAFPAHTDYVNLLKKMLARSKSNDESMMHYFYSKNMLVKKCGLVGTNAVSCIIDDYPYHCKLTQKLGTMNHQTSCSTGSLAK
ncbi:unnamed protein product [Acanthoscelides obtectus]|uniref:Retrotransposon gag domain-containing protein n=1 Tax=Acanthoscelides obtectus TaxID=200917 RepID=A0A9P0QI11_ACAOB|nr:unnamed protein product [Acanthoscelides obtectus]CAK1684143.1 hypothetical protein AOBTE_LOCUS34655 [Acanthoscelides obtectus]